MDEEKLARMGNVDEVVADANEVVWVVYDDVHRSGHRTMPGSRADNDRLPMMAIADACVAAARLVRATSRADSRQKPKNLVTQKTETTQLATSLCTRARDAGVSIRSCMDPYIRQ